MTTSAEQWLEGYAARLGVDVPSRDERETILALAGIAAHASERTAAPIACWIAARAGLSVEEAMDVARVVEVLDAPDHEHE